MTRRINTAPVLPLLSCLVSFVILWKPILVVLFKDWGYERDLSLVFLSNSCLRSNSLTIFAFSLLEVLVACQLLKAFVVPSFFGQDRWDKYDGLRQRKMIGFFVKILVRAACAVQILMLVTPCFSFREGLFSEFNVNAANIKLRRDHTLTTCKEARMTLQNAASLRAWALVRDCMMAVMMWELAFIPELPADAWLHHILVILGVAVGGDPMQQTSDAEVQPVIDGVALFLVLGASLAAAFEGPVLMYHLVAPDATRQARWMLRSILLQAALVIILFITLPAVLLSSHTGALGGMVFSVLALLAFLVAVEIKRVLCKWAIYQSTLCKLSNSQVSIAEGESMVSSMPSSFHHDMGQESLLRRRDFQVFLRRLAASEDTSPTNGRPSNIELGFTDECAVPRSANSLVSFVWQHTPSNR